MNIIGILSDESEAHEVERIAKIFVVEERIRHITPEKPILIIKNPIQEPSKKPSTSNICHYHYLPMLAVKGLN